WPSPTASTKGVMRPGQAASSFDLRRYSPGRPVDFFVENYWLVRWDLTGRPAYRQEGIPHPCLDMSVEAGSPAEVRPGYAMPAALVHGVFSRRFCIDLIGTGRVLGVRFRPGGFAALTGRDASALTDQVVPLSHVFGSTADELARDVLAEDDDERRVKLTDDFLAAHAASARRAAGAGHAAAAGRAYPAGHPAAAHRYELVLTVVADMLEDRSLVRVSQVTRKHALSSRTLQRLFRHYVGASPKWVLARYRLHDAAERIERDPDVPIAAVAAAAGYF